MWSVPYSAPGNRRIAIRHCGTWRREGIICTPEFAHVSSDAALVRALLPLDFTRCELIQDAMGWQCQLTHFGASEVVFRTPPLRQYVRITREQVDSMLAAFSALARLLTATHCPLLINAKSSRVAV
jgi:hypothetical protein